MESNVVKVADVGSKRAARCDVVLRMLVAALTLVVVVVVGTDRETKDVVVTLPKLPPLHVPVTAKWHYLSAIVYLLVSNAVAFSYAAASALISIATKTIRSNLAFVFTVADAIVLGLLFSATGAAAAVGVLAKKGNQHVHWDRVCYMFEGFCRHMTAGVILSLLASLVSLLLVVLAVFNLQKKSK